MAGIVNIYVGRAFHSRGGAKRYSKPHIALLLSRTQSGDD